MFEGYTLEQQREVEVARGWKPTYSALTYCTAEAILHRGKGHVLDHEILIAERTSGAPDCLGKIQGKWGTYVKPTDRNAECAIKRSMSESFGWDDHTYNATFEGIVGPELYKARLRYISREKQQDLVLDVTEQQGESTPFQATLFSIEVAPGRKFGSGSYGKSTKNAQWIELNQLIKEQGENPNFLYWTMIAIYIHRNRPGVDFCGGPKFEEFSPGEHIIECFATDDYDPDKDPARPFMT